MTVVAKPTSLGFLGLEWDEYSARLLAEAEARLGLAACAKMVSGPMRAAFYAGALAFANGMCGGMGEDDRTEVLMRWKKLWDEIEAYRGMGCDEFKRTTLPQMDPEEDDDQS